MKYYITVYALISFSAIYSMEKQEVSLAQLEKNYQEEKENEDVRKMLAEIRRRNESLTSAVIKERLVKNGYGKFVEETQIHEKLGSTQIPQDGTREGFIKGYILGLDKPGIDEARVAQIILGK